MLRLPTAADLDKNGLVRMVVKKKVGGKVVNKVVRVSPVDAREIIYSDSGSLDLPEDLEKTDNKSIHIQQLYATLSLDELRLLCKDNNISFTGKPPSALRQVLIDAGVMPPSA